MAIIYYPPEGVESCQANNVPISVFSGWAVANGDPKLDLLVQSNFLRSVNVPSLNISKPGFVDEHIDVASGKLTREELAKKLNLTIVNVEPSVVAGQPLSNPAINPYNQTSTNTTPTVQSSVPLQFPDQQKSSSQEDAMDLLEILNRRHGNQETSKETPLDMTISQVTGTDKDGQVTNSVIEESNKDTVEESKPVKSDTLPTVTKTYKHDEIRSMNDKEVADLASSHGIILDVRNTRRKQENDLIRLGVIV